MEKLLKISFWVLLGIIGSLTQAFAAETQAFLGVRAGVSQEGCTVTIGPRLEFIGTTSDFEDPNGVPAETTINVNCPVGLPHTIGLRSLYGANDMGQGQLQRAGFPSIIYTLYQDQNYQTIWGNMINLNTKNGLTTGGTNTYPIYGKTQQMSPGPAPGEYLDTIAVTIAW